MGGAGHDAGGTHPRGVGELAGTATGYAVVVQSFASLVCFRPVGTHCPLYLHRSPFCNLNLHKIRKKLVLKSPCVSLSSKSEDTPEAIAATAAEPSRHALVAAAAPPDLERVRPPALPPIFLPPTMHLRFTLGSLALTCYLPRRTKTTAIAKAPGGALVPEPKMNNQRVLEPTITGMPVRILRRVHALWPPLCTGVHTSTLPHWSPG